MSSVEQWCRDNFNMPVLHGLEVVRCIGYGESAVDQYIIMQCPRLGVFWNSAVGGYTSLLKLKGQGYVRAHNGEDWDDMTRLDGDLTRSGVPKVAEFVLDLRPDDFEGMPD